tara:strand:- start:44 stop:352 length:309 start_codon:yes stop_codon:yes gene_type:complete
MPRRAPDGKGVTEHRITLGTWERTLISETKADVEKTVKVATITAVAVPLATIGGFGLLGFGIYRAGIFIGKGLENFQLMDWSDTDDKAMKGLRAWFDKTFKI